MKFTKSRVHGACVVEIEKFEDERGFVAYGWSEQEFAREGLKERFVEMIVSYNIRKGTLRGMHFQNEPFAQAKLVRCTQGAIYDVVIDLRPESSTFKKWDAVELTAHHQCRLER